MYRFVKSRRASTLIKKYLVFGLLVLSLLTIFVTRVPQATAKDQSRIVNVYVDGKAQSFPTSVATVGDFLDKVHISLASEDLVEPSRDTPILEDSFNINIYRARPVVYSKDRTDRVILTGFQSPHRIAQLAGVELSEVDDVKLSQIDNIVEQGVMGERLSVVPAKLVHVNLYGTDIPMHTREIAVQELLETKNIKINSKDRIMPSVQTEITDGMTVTVSRDGTELVLKEELPFSTEVIEDSNMFVSQERTEAEGSAGSKITAYEILNKDGKETGRNKLQEITLTTPTKRVVVKGTKPIVIRSSVPIDKQRVMAAAGLPQSDWEGADYIISHESGWCATKWQGSRVCPAEFIPSGGGPGYGLCQSTPATKMASAGADWQTNPLTQLKWCTNYARSRYGGWPQAYAHWLVSHNW